MGAHCELGLGFMDGIPVSTSTRQTKLRSIKLALRVLALNHPDGYDSFTLGTITYGTLVLKYQ